MTKNLQINFYAEKMEQGAKGEFLDAVEYESADMNVKMLTDSIEKLDSKIANTKGDYSAEEVQAFQVQRDAQDKLRTELEDKMFDLSATYNKVLAAMTVKKDGFGNKKDVVRTVLRVLASWNDSKLVKYAIIPAFQSPELYEALNAIHVNSKASDDGALVMSNEVKEAYKKASQELETIIKETFSLPFETPYTAKTRVKLTAADKKLLNDCYVKGFNNKFDVDEDTGKVSFKKRQINTLCRVKRNKKTDEVTVDYSGLATCIASIVIKHYFA